MEQVADERQPARFATQRAAANLEEEGTCGLKRCGIEFADEGLALLAAIFRDRLDQIAAQGVERAKVADCARPQLLRQGEFGSRHQPVRKVIAFAMIGQALLWNGMQLGFQRIQIGGPSLLPFFHRAGGR